MKQIYQKVLEHADGERGTCGKKNIADLIEFLNTETELTFPQNSIAIHTIIRQSYNYYTNESQYDKATQVAETYQPEEYVWKVKNKYK
jgi:hypothetical protein